MPLFAAIQNHGPRWQTSLPLEAQEGWADHATFMNALESEGFIVLGGPIEGTDEVPLIFRAESAQQIAARLAADPWVAQGLLHLSRVSRWDLRLGSLRT